MDKRFIEESFPVKEVSIESAKEKSIRFGNISTLHIWWARRPLTSSRATNYAALIPFPENVEDWNKKRNIIIELSKWKAYENKSLLKKVQDDILKAYNGRRPKILDPFAGGGAIPLEAMRIGCDTYASDYNPVAVLIEKCSLEFPQKFNKQLVIDVKQWGEWVLEETKKEIGEYYLIKNNEDPFFKSIRKRNVVAYLWARTIKCQNPTCYAEIPLLRQFWLVKKKDKKVSLYPIIKGKKLKFKIVGTGFEKIPIKFDPNKGTVKRSIATCLVCGNVLTGNEVRKQFQEGNASARMIAVVFSEAGLRGKKYKISSQNDFELYKKAEKYLNEKLKNITIEWGLEPVPDEEISIVHTITQRPFAPRENYHIMHWGDLFNSRQKLALITITEKIRQVYVKLVESGSDKEYAKAIVTYLALLLDKIASSSNTLTRWQPNGEKIADLFSRPALTMVWDYPEVNILTGASRSYLTLFSDILRVIQQVSTIKNKSAKVGQYSATDLPYEDNFFDAVFTDPPYYDNITYSYLSDFFYVWLKRTIGNLYMDLFSTPKTPKSKEIVAYLKESWDIEDGKNFYEKMLLKAFKEIYRVLKINGIAIIVYAHKTTEGWETVINALLNSGLVVTASWPISTEMKSRLRGIGSAALASSIYIVARKINMVETGFYPEIKKELNSYLNEKLDRLWNEGISGSDFFISAIGAGIEVSGKYSKIIDYEGNIIKADILLEDIRKVVTNFAVTKILHNGFSDKLSPLSRFYILWRWNFQENRVIFDEGRKLAQSIGINLEKEWDNGFIKKEKNFIRVLGPKERNIDKIEKSEELIDVLHHILLLWEKSKKEEILTKILKIFNNSEILYRVAQAISQCLSNESKEKKLLDGFLTGIKGLKEIIEISKSQDKLDRWTK